MLPCTLSNKRHPPHQLAATSRADQAISHGTGPARAVPARCWSRGSGQRPSGASRCLDRAASISSRARSWGSAATPGWTWAVPLRHAAAGRQLSRDPERRRGCACRAAPYLWGLLTGRRRGASCPDGAATVPTLVIGALRDARALANASRACMPAAGGRGRGGRLHGLRFRAVGSETNGWRTWRRQPCRRVRIASRPAHSYNGR
jgi:hypothetical protein